MTQPGTRSIQTRPTAWLCLRPVRLRALCASSMWRRLVRTSQSPQRTRQLPAGHGHAAGAPIGSNDLFRSMRLSEHARARRYAPRAGLAAPTARPHGHASGRTGPPPSGLRHCRLPRIYAIVGPPGRGTFRVHGPVQRSGERQVGADMCAGHPDSTAS